MPTIAWFYGIAVQMFFNDHDPPHFHARYGRAKALFRIADGKMIAGELPPTAERLVHEWALARKPELEENWNRARSQRRLEKIAGPDGKG
ncbi:MAG TPA: DUF4160 domain-containing protein [Rhizomicrobium sp.]|jgi:hypothetical protein|nr:DUF4160 domain-containing protein [Rhizomicrobium sp.]